jgi:hypothetical protein
MPQGKASGAQRQQVLAGLRQRVELAKKSANRAAARKKGASFAMRGQRGTQNAEIKMVLIQRAAEGSGPNVEVAMKVLKVFKAAREERINPEADPFGGHQILVNVANALVKRENINRHLKEYEDVRLTPRQKKALDYWYEAAKRAGGD